MAKNKINPLSLIDDILADYVSAKTRRLIHSLLLLAAVVATVWLTVDGDWREAVMTLLGAVYAGANRANTPDDGDNVPGLDEEGQDTEGIEYVDDSEPDYFDLPIAAPHGGPASDQIGRNPRRLAP